MFDKNGRNIYRILSVIVLTIAIIGVFSACAPNNDVKLNDNTNTTNTQNQTGEQKAAEEKTYKLGETITVNNLYELTINKVSLTQERNEFAEQKVEKVAVIEYSYKNINSDEDLFIGDINFKVYDEEGNALETYPAGADKYPQAIGKGKQCTAEMSFGFNKGTKLELQYYDNMFNNKADAKFLVEAK